MAASCTCAPPCCAASPPIASVRGSRLHLSAGRALVAVTAGQTRNPPTFELALPKLALVAVAAREGDYAAAMLLAIPEILLVTVAVGVGQDAVAV